MTRGDWKCHKIHPFYPPQGAAPLLGCFGSEHHGSSLTNMILSDSSAPVTIRGTQGRLD